MKRIHGRQIRNMEKQSISNSAVDAIRELLGMEGEDIIVHTRYMKVEKPVRYTKWRSYWHVVIHNAKEHLYWCRNFREFQRVAHSDYGND